jgi:glycosyltransferase involved in cell wall biosynthesis
MEGFVDDLHLHLSQYTALVAPIVSGTGVKTKVLDAMASAVPVIGTPAAFAGLSVQHGRDAFVGRNPKELADQISRVLASPSEAIRVGRAGRDYVEQNFSPAIVVQRWRAVMDRLSNHEMRQSTSKGHNE